MTKKIIQTTIITLIAIMCVIAFTWGAVTIISPYTMGKFSQKLGADKSASAYFEIDYKRNKSDDRLYNLVSSTFYANKYGKTIKYGNELLKRESFVNSYTNKNYIDIVIYVEKSKYYTGNENLVEFVLEHAFHKDGEKIVDFKEYSTIIDSVMFLASSKGDKATLDNLYSSMVVTEKIGEDSFMDNVLDSTDGYTSDYEQYVITIYTLTQLQDRV